MMIFTVDFLLFQGSKFPLIRYSVNSKKIVGLPAACLPLIRRISKKKFPRSSKSVPKLIRLFCKAMLKRTRNPEMADASCTRETVIAVTAAHFELRVR